MELAIVQPRDLDDHHHHQQHQQASESLKTRVKKNFSLETYLAFLLSPQIQSLTVDHLNKILSIHGFKKHKNRKLAEEAVGGINDPLHPGRSTLNDSSSVSPSAGNRKAVVTLTEAVKDLKQLNWQECSITSIRTISPMDYSSSSPADLPAEEVAAQLMSLKGNKRCRSPMPPGSTSLPSSRIGRRKKDGSKRASGGTKSSGMIPSVGAKRKPRSKRASMKKIHYDGNGVTALAATASST